MWSPCGNFLFLRNTPVAVQSIFKTWCIIRWQALFSDIWGGEGLIQTWRILQQGKYLSSPLGKWGICLSHLRLPLASGAWREERGCLGHPRYLWSKKAGICEGYQEDFPSLCFRENTLCHLGKVGSIIQVCRDSPSFSTESPVPWGPPQYQSN